MARWNVEIGIKMPPYIVPKRKSVDSVWRTKCAVTGIHPKDMFENSGPFYTAFCEWGRGRIFRKTMVPTIYALVNEKLPPDRDKINRRGLFT